MSLPAPIDQTLTAKALRGLKAVGYGVLIVVAVLFAIQTWMIVYALIGGIIYGGYRAWRWMAVRLKSSKDHPNDKGGLS